MCPAVTSETPARLARKHNIGAPPPLRNIVSEFPFSVARVAAPLQAGGLLNADLVQLFVFCTLPPRSPCVLSWSVVETCGLPLFPHNSHASPPLASLFLVAFECSDDIANLKLLAGNLVQGLAADTADLALGLGSFSDIEVRSLVNPRAKIRVEAGVIGFVFLFFRSMVHFMSAFS